MVGERTETVRQAIRRALEGNELTAREVSQAVGVAEREVVEHLDALARSSGAPPRIRPAACLACGFRFIGRARASRPSRCPECRSERLAPPRFSLP